MELEFDPTKDRANLEKHGLSFGAFEGWDAEPLLVVDHRFFYGETRYRAFGRIGGLPHCLAFTIRGDKMRLIMFRRAHEKEMRRYEARKD